jgi:hypothetical protein
MTGSPISYFLIPCDRRIEFDIKIPIRGCNRAGRKGGIEVEDFTREVLPHQK